MTDKMENANSQVSAAIESSESEGEALVEQLMGLLGNSEFPDERRHRDRYPISCKMQLIPLDGGRPLMADSCTVFGKDLSRRGVSFMHDLPLASKRFILSFVLCDNSQFAVEAEATWSNRTLIGLHESGCRLIRKIGAHKLADLR